MGGSRCVYFSTSTTSGGSRRRDATFRFVSFHAFQEVLLAVRLLQWTWEDVEGRFPFPRPIREHLRTCSFGGERSGGPVTISPSLYRSSIARDLRVDLSIARWFRSILVDFSVTRFGVNCNLFLWRDKGMYIVRKLNCRFMSW